MDGHLNQGGREPMAEKKQLTWHKGRRVWMKKYRPPGATKPIYRYFPGGSGRSDRAAYNQAVSHWKDEKAKIDEEHLRGQPNRELYEDAAAELRLMTEWMRKFGVTDKLEEVEATLASLDAAIRSPKPPPPLPAGASILSGLLQRRKARFVEFHAKYRVPAEELVVEPPSTEDVRVPVRPEPPPRDRLLSPEEVDEYKRKISEWGRELAKCKGEAINRTEQARQQRLNIAQLTMLNDFMDYHLADLEDDRELGAWLERLQMTLHANMPRDPDRTIRAAIKAFLQKKQGESKAGGISSGRVDMLRLHLSFFENWIGGNKEVSSITARVFDNFHGHLVERLEQSAFSQSYARDILASTKQLVRWCWETERLASIPRNLEGRSIQIHVDLPAKGFFTADEVQNLLNGAVDRVKLYILLMLNCGMTQKDISDLQQSQVDWRDGRIRRRRSKTKDSKSVPIVDYRLWKETFGLMKRFRSDHGERALLNQNGAPLWSVTLVGGRRKKTDAIKSAYYRLARKLGVDKPPKLLRKTSANLLKSNPRFASLADYFLGHAPRSVGEKHYYEPSRDLFDEALAWLETELLKPSTAKKKSRRK